MSDAKDRLSELRIDRTLEEQDNPWPRRIALLALALILFSAAWWWFMLRDTALEVELATVTRARGNAATGVSVLDASGYVTARRQATVSSKITGKIVEVLIEEGMVVEEGQLLARLDDSLFSRSLALSEAQLASARSNLREIEVRRDEAEVNLRRTRRLAQSGVESERALDAAQAEFDSMAARLEASRDVVVVAECEIELRRQELEDTRIRAPFGGVAISKNAQPGEMISPVSAGGGFTRTGVTTIVDMTSLEIEVDVNEAYINRVEPDQRVVATLDAYPEWQIPAHVITTIPAADRQKATVRVRIGFDELGDSRILPDMGIKVSFQEAAAVEQPSATRLLVPQRALRRDGDRDLLFIVVGEGVIERRAVAVGGEIEGRREILSGAREGESVVLDPPAGLAEGARVKSRP